MPHPARSAPTQARAHLRQWRRAWPVLLAASGLTAILIGTLLAVNARTHIPLMQFTRDAAALRYAPWYTGLVTQLGLLGWGAAAGATLAGYLALRGPEAVMEQRRYLLGGALLSMWLGLDDALMLHEAVIPRAIEVREAWVYAAYIALVLGYFALHSRRVRASPWLLLVITLALFSLPVLMDMAGLAGPAQELYLATAKLAGILCWAGYWAQSAGDSWRVIHGRCVG